MLTKGIYELALLQMFNQTSSIILRKTYHSQNFKIRFQQIGGSWKLKFIKFNEIDFDYMM